MFKSERKCKAAIPPILRPACVLTAAHGDDPNYLDAVGVMEGLEVLRRNDGLDPDEDPVSTGSDDDVEVETV